MINPTIAITAGEPAGIGPDICIQIAQQAQHASLVIIADPDLLEQRAQALGLPLTCVQYERQNITKPLPPGHIFVQPIRMAIDCVPGKLDSKNAGYVLETLRKAADGCQQGHYAAMVTGPVQKSIISEAGYTFSGHTEFLAEHTNTNQVVMMLATEGLRVALATTHIPLSEVPKAITDDLLRSVVEILNRDLIEKFAIAKPRVLVCGLNPHAGENGHLGREEIEVIEPALEALRNRGYNLQGPLPADTLFTPKYLEHTDAVLAMYHDQGLPVLKNVGFGNAVNITLGLPIIRTSVDHGTALDLAATGKANPQSLQVAINYAVDMARSIQTGR